MKQIHMVPAFISKLWTLVEARTTNDLICWSQNGCSFIVQDEQRFSKEVLPLYFKHSNMTSFVRQLNMYGFHKVVQVDTGLPKADSKETCVEFQHEDFQKDQPHLLGLIRRKASVSRGIEDGGQMSQVLVQVRHVRGWQDSSNLKLMALCRDNENLWRELDVLRQNYLQHHKIIRKMVKFIINSVQLNGIKGCKRKLPMIDNNEFQSSPKYTRSTYNTLPENPSLQELDVSPGDVYSSGTIISDITHLLDPSPEPNKGSFLPETFSPESPTVPCAELPFSWLDDPAVQEPGEILLERNDMPDPLALIDSSLEAIRSCPPASPDTDNFSELLYSDCNTSAGKHSESQSQARNQNEADTGNELGSLEEESYDGEEFSDILPSLLQLAQEASSLSFSNATLPLELPFAI
ncbi:hypothetical protein DNTS_033436 [Danionella cerebrum]|uniref:HSF-type DNA-binding domain-containing protein n=1 Tax=Danionella cerebrum TaxID=2873325 RepID=A0A553R930_9TELE|nr:hypothetical protein DNTS_033436 [Danionella translucida]